MGKVEKVVMSVLVRVVMVMAVKNVVVAVPVAVNK